ncbi:MAG: hypothetical protein WCR13_10925 [Sphaerochaeta sp.]
MSQWVGDEGALGEEKGKECSKGVDKGREDGYSTVLFGRRKPVSKAKEKSTKCLTLEREIG